MFDLILVNNRLVGEEASALQGGWWLGPTNSFEHVRGW
jgi:hypothetical protein